MEYTEENINKLLIAGEASLCSSIASILYKKYSKHDEQLTDDEKLIKISNKYFKSVIKVDLEYIQASLESQVDTNYIRLSDDQEETSSTFQLNSSEKVLELIDS